MRIFLASLLLAGCGSVKDSGAPVDAPVDVSTVDADTSGDATIVTEAALVGGTVGVNVGNIDIISMLPNNTVLAMTKTDAGGNATIKVFPGGTVTAVYKHTVDMGADLITYVGVKPGDTLTFGSRNFSTAGQTNTNIGSQTYSWPAQAGSTSYNVFTSCTGIGVGGASTSVVGTEFSLCHKEPMDVLYGAFNGQLTHYNFRQNVAFTNGGTVSISGWIPVTNATVNITGIPTDVTNVSGNFSSVLDNNREIGLAGSFNGTLTGGAFTQNFVWHPGGDRTMSQMFFSRTGFGAMRLLDSFASGTLTETVASPTFPPWQQSGVIVSSALRTANWFLVPDAASVHDGQLLFMNWNHVVGGTNHFHQWHLILPPGQLSIVLPKLPAQFTDNLPFPQDGIGASIRAFDVGSLTSYDMVRAQPSRNIMCLECSIRGGDYQRVVFSGN